MRKLLILSAIVLLVSSCNQDDKTMNEVSLSSVFYSHDYVTEVDGVVYTTYLTVLRDKRVMLAGLPEGLIAFETPSYCGILNGETEVVFKVKTLIGIENEFSQIVCYYPTNGESITIKK